jgi:hypothetical protein
MTKSPSLHYVPNQALSDQKQAIWMGRQCFRIRTKSLFIQIKWMLWRPVLCNPQINFEPFFCQPNVNFYHQKQNKKFSSLLKPLNRNQLNFFRMSLLLIDVKMISMSGIALKFQKFCMKTTPCQKPNLPSYSLIPKENPIWILGGMIKLGSNPKTHGRVSSVIPS